MIKLLFGILILALCSCGQQTVRKMPGEKIGSGFTTSANTLDTLISGRRLVVDDTTKYAPSFIRDLREVYPDYDTLKVVGDSLFLWYKPFQKPDTTVRQSYWIPTNLELNKEVAFSISQEGRSYLLTLKRTNYTDLSYRLSQEGQTVKVGIASLQGSFFFGPEGEPGPIFLHQYVDQSNDGTIIKVEIENARLAIIIFTINGKDYIETGLMKRI